MTPTTHTSGSGASAGTAWDKPWPFDPSSDYPPHGAAVDYRGSWYTFIDGTSSFPHWLAPNGAVARPFDQAGVTLATAWAATQAQPAPNS